MARARRGRRRKGDQSPVTREEFNALIDQMALIEQRAMFGRGIQAVPGGGAGGDDGYEPTYPGSIDNSGTVGGYLPGEIPYLTDGDAPDSSPTPVAEGGLGFLSVKWPAVANADRVTYEVHVSTVNNFTPDASTLAGETPGLLAFIHRKPDGTPFLFGTTYYVKIMAKDADGGGYADPTPIASAQDSTVLVKVPTTDVATDGVTPTTPVVTLTSGPGWLQARWPLNTATKDPVSYWVYISDTSGFTPGGGNFVGMTKGNSMVINKLTAGTQLVTGTTYYVKVIAASDISGVVSATSTEVSGTPAVLDASVTTVSNLNAGTITTGTLDAARIAAGSLDASKITANTISATQIATDAITADELAADSVFAENIVAGEVLAEHIESVLNVATSFLSGAIDSSNVQVGFGSVDDGTGVAIIDPTFLGVRAYDGVNADPVFKLPADGTPATFKGVVKFGSTGDSKLLQNDMIQIKEQSGGAFATPLLIQTQSRTEWGGHSTASAWFDEPVTPGNTIIGVLTHWESSGAGTHTLPAGFSSQHQLSWADSSFARTQVFGKVATGAADEGQDSSNSIDVTISKSIDVYTLRIYEFSGITLTEDAISLDVSTTANGVQGLNTTAIGTPTQQVLLFGVAAAWGDFRYAGHVSPSFPGIKTSSYPSDWTFIGQDENHDHTGGVQTGNDIETNYFMKLATGGTNALFTETNADSLGGVGIIISLRAATNQVEPAEVDTARIYAQDIGGNTYLHSQDEDGRESAIVLGKAGEVWRMEYMTGTKDLANINAHSASTETVTVTGVAVGDIVIFLEKVAINRGLLIRAEPLVTVANTIELHIFNTDTVAIDPASSTFHFLVIHRT